MDFLAPLSWLNDTVIGYLLPFVFVLTIVVFFHELGHFLVARWCGVAVKVFSIGFGPEIFGWTDGKGTRWRVSWVPLGGYVKFLDDENVTSAAPHAAADSLSEAERAGSFHLKPLRSRAAVVAAGPIANFILAIAIFTVIFSVFGRTVLEPMVDQVAPDSAAAEAGFQPGDVVRSINGDAIESFSDMQRIVSVSAGVRLQIEIERNGQPLTLVAVPRMQEISDNFGNKQRIGLLGLSRTSTGENRRLERFSVPSAFVLAVKETWFFVARTMGYLYDVVAGRQAADQLGGPIQIAQVSGQVASVGLLALINLSAVLSISIGLLNLFPIPMLDGGHLLYYGIEGLRGRPLSERAQEFGFRIGLMIVLGLMILATWNDLVRLQVL
ncbi:MAG: RIP metalloprotease RseP [Rhodobiaceae bacterium]|nr:RIP metalloprotease RseP [Rhodobiaceae bacterium]